MLHHKYDDELDIPLNLHKSTKATRGTHKLSKTKFHKNTRKYFFKNRVVNFWNRLPDVIKCANSINIFKNKLDDLWKPLKIAHNFENCLDFVEQHFDVNYAGTVIIDY